MTGASPPAVAIGIVHLHSVVRYTTGRTVHSYKRAVRPIAARRQTDEEARKAALRQDGTARPGPAAAELGWMRSLTHSPSRVGEGLVVVAVLLRESRH